MALPVLLLLLAFSLATVAEESPLFGWETPKTEFTTTTISTTKAPFRTRSLKAEQKFQGKVYKELKTVSYAQLKSYLPKEIVDFFENIEFRDFKYLQEAVMYAVRIFEFQAKRHPETPVEELLTTASWTFHEVLNYPAPKLAEQLEELEGVLKEKYFQLQEPTRNALENFFKAALILATKEDSQMNDEEKAAVIKAGNEIHLLPSYDETTLSKDVFTQFPELETFCETKLYASITTLFYIVLGQDT